MRSDTMKPYDDKKAWEKRFDLYIKEGTELIVENQREYKVVKVIIPENRLEMSPHYVLTPIGKTLKEHKREHNELAKLNPHLMKVGVYPDFSFEVEAMWFFSRDVKIK